MSLSFPIPSHERGSTLVRPVNRGPRRLTSWAQSNLESADITTGTGGGGAVLRGAPTHGSHADNTVQILNLRRTRAESGVISLAPWSQVASWRVHTVVIMGFFDFSFPKVSEAENGLTDGEIVGSGVTPKTPSGGAVITLKLCRWLF